MRGKVCAVFGCSNYEVEKSARSFFRFPRDKNMCDLWVLKCHRSDLDKVYKKEGTLRLYKNYKICSDHIQASDFRNPRQYSQGMEQNHVTKVELEFVDGSEEPSSEGLHYDDAHVDDDGDDDNREPDAFAEQDSDSYQDLDAIYILTPKVELLCPDDDDPMNNGSDSNTDKGSSQPNHISKHGGVSKTRRRNAGKKNRCPICHKTFSRRDTLKIHKATHGEDRPFVCNVCKKDFKRRDILKNHEVVHSGVRPFQCKKCDMSFSRSSYLSRHQMDKHTFYRPYVCSVCRKAFRRRAHLDEHMITHTRDVIFSCPECGKCFQHRCNLVIHMKDHTGQDLLYCNDCDKTFKRRRDLQLHTMKHTRSIPSTSTS